MCAKSSGNFAESHFLKSNSAMWRFSKVGKVNGQVNDIGMLTAWHWIVIRRNTMICVVTALWSKVFYALTDGSYRVVKVNVLFDCRSKLSPRVLDLRVNR
jgi:hypothetical protein